MNNGLKVAVGCLGVFAVSIVLLLVTLVPMYFQASNAEVRLRNQFNAQNKNMEVVFDNTWKIIEQQAGVSEEYKESFKEIYPSLMTARYGNARGGALMSWVQENNPTFSTALYEKLSNSIEVQRNIFTREQQKSIDLKREHDNLRTTFPTSIFLSSRPELELRLVTSAKTDKAFETGKDNDVKLFKK